jgi:hypothetical protein
MQRYSLIPVSGNPFTVAPLVRKLTNIADAPKSFENIGVRLLRRLAG